MAKYQILICALLVASVSGGLFSKNKDTGESSSPGSIKEKAKSLFHLGSKSDDEDEFQEEELNHAEEELSRVLSTIDGETMRKMADVNNHDIPVLSLDDQAAIVDKGVDFSKPFDVSKVKSVLATVIQEKLPQDAPPMSTEELINMKDTMEKPADPAAAKAIEAEKKEVFKATHGSSGASKKKPASPKASEEESSSPAEPSSSKPMSYLNAARKEPSPSSSPSSKGPSFLDKAKDFVEDGANKVAYHADEFIENFKAGDTSDSDDDDKPAASPRGRNRPKIHME